jgi:type IV secretion system protein VirD4
MGQEMFPAKIYVGQIASPEHVMCFAPTRSGKGVGLVLPTLLSWTSSAVVHDIKGENWHRTEGRRSGFSRGLLFDPTDGRTARYNPIEVRKAAAEVRDVQNIADILVDPEARQNVVPIGKTPATRCSSA